jgi:hypothetical protein
MRKGKRKVMSKQQSIFDHEIELRQKALEISKNHVHTKPIKFLVKR